MKVFFTILLSIGMHSVYGQYGYVPQVPLDALYRNLAYKQQLYDQRKAQLQERMDYTFGLIQRLNSDDYDSYLKHLNDNLKVIGSTDLTDSDNFFPATESPRRGGCAFAAGDSVAINPHPLLIKYNHRFCI